MYCVSVLNLTGQEGNSKVKVEASEHIGDFIHYIYIPTTISALSTHTHSLHDSLKQAI